MARPIYKGTDANGMPVFTSQKFIFALCDVIFKDGAQYEDFIIKLNTEYNEDEDDQIFFYCEDYESFLSLCTDEFREDFRVTTIHKFYETL